MSMSTSDGASSILEKTYEFAGYEHASKRLCTDDITAPARKPTRQISIGPDAASYCDSATL